MEIWKLRKNLAAFVACAVVGQGFLAFSRAGSQIPPEALIYKETEARFENQPQPRKVVFYVLRNHSAGVAVLSPKNETITGVTVEARLGLYDGTGVYDVTGDNWPEVVLVAWVGGKTIEATIYRFHDLRLEEIFRWSGWSFRVVKLRGGPVVAVTPFQYGSLTDLYVWRGGGFQKSNELFPQFYGPEIGVQKQILDGHDPLPLSVFTQACDLGARALVYGKLYDEAEELCRKALQIVRNSPRAIPNRIDASAQEFAAERREADCTIEEMLKRIGKARAGRRTLLRD